MGWIEEHDTREVEKQRKRFYFGEVFSEQLARWKRIHKKTDKDFANTIGVHPNMIPKWKQGKSYPQAAKMEAICKEFGVKESVFLNLGYITNASREERSKYLQMYAEENGMDEDFYSWMIHRPNFIQIFPFHAIGITLSKWSEDEHPEEKAFPLLKFEFEDEHGIRKMMVEEDIDFILKIQDKVTKNVIPAFLTEKEKIKKERVQQLIEKRSKEYGVDAEKVKEEFYNFSFAHEELTWEYDQKLDFALQTVAVRSGVWPPRIHIDDVFPPAGVQSYEAYAKELKDAGYNDEEIAVKVEECKQADAQLRAASIEHYRRKGFIVEEGGTQDKKE